jgi:maltooligosyltrehalose trehalohydrolase
MSGHRAYSFGPLIDGDSVRFRLWAPAAREAMLEVEGAAPVPMNPVGNGWIEACARCAPNTRYAFRLNGTRVADPASRRQSGGVHGWSQLSNAASYSWRCERWNGRPWHETVHYETHVGLEGGFRCLAERLADLRGIGITAIELMPISAFPGERNWGYDGVLPFAPAEVYGSPDDLKALVDSAHEQSLMIFLDVVYNHFGPDGNYLGLYAPEFFRHDVATPWGAAIDFRQHAVRRFFIENALYWIHEFRFDGLRFDAVHTISERDWLIELAGEVRASLPPGRQVHLVVENDNNDPELLRHGFDAQWNDDFHHVLHHLLTGERSGYYGDHADDPAERLARVLREGFDYQGAHSRHRKGARGASSGDLPPTAFVSFLQNHDQTGNRARGDRLTTLTDEDALEAAIALLLLSPQIPLIFMGDEIGSRAPFLYFTDHTPELAQLVRKGRAAEFPSQTDSSVPDPNALETFRASRPRDTSGNARWQSYYRRLLGVRQTEIIPRLKGTTRSIDANAIGDAAVVARWRMSDGDVLTLSANFGRESVSVRVPRGRTIWGSPTGDVLPQRTTLGWIEGA